MRRTDSGAWGAESCCRPTVHTETRRRLPSPTTDPFQVFSSPPRTSPSPPVQPFRSQALAKAVSFSPFIPGRCGIVSFPCHKPGPGFTTVSPKSVSTRSLLAGWNMELGVLLGYQVQMRPHWGSVGPYPLTGVLIK